MKKRWKRVLLICILALWALFAVTRFGRFTTYLPFSGRLFAIDSTEVTTNFIQNGTTGQQHFFETEEEKTQIAEVLNGLRYRVWLPTIPIAKGGWSYRIAIETEDRQYSYSFGPRDMTVNGIIYWVPTEQLSQLMEYVE